MPDKKRQLSRPRRAKPRTTPEQRTEVMRASAFRLVHTGLREKDLEDDMPVVAKLGEFTRFRKILRDMLLDVQDGFFTISDIERRPEAKS